MKSFLSATALALVLGLAAGAMTVSPVAAKNGETVQDRANGPQTPMPVYGPRSAGPIYSAGPRLVTVVEQPYVLRTGPVLVEPSYQSYVVARSQPLIVRQPATITTRAYYVYAPSAPIYAVPPLGAAASVRLADRLAVIEPAAGSSSQAAARLEFERIDANNDGSISGNEYVYYRERFGKPVYWNY